MKKLPKALQYSLFLIILGIIVGTLLAFVNKVTLPIIEERKMEEVSRLLKEIVPEGKSFEIVSEDYKNRNENIKEIYIAFKDKNQDEQIAVIYQVVTNGYGSGIESLVAIGFKTQGFIDVQIVAAPNETAGIGDVIFTHDFEVSNKDLDYKVDNIVGVTRSVNGVQAALDIAAKHFKSAKFVIPKKDEADEEALANLVPEADTFTNIAGEFSKLDSKIHHVYLASKDGENIAVVYHTVTNGLGRDMETLVVIDLTNDKYLDLLLYKTPGETPSYIEQIHDADLDIPGQDMDFIIDNVEGVTRSTNGIKAAMSLASQHYLDNNEKIKGLEG